MVAFALRADGWYLRQENIWAKPNPMPESVTDRCTKSHEHVFLMSKSERYFWDYDAMQEEAVADHAPGNNNHKGAEAYAAGASEHRTNAGLVAYSQRQRKRGVPPRHSAYENSDQSGLNDVGRGTRNKRDVWTIATQPFTGAHFAVMPQELAKVCILAGSRPGDTVLDPFGGSGTTGIVADRHGRHSTLIELNPEYAQMMRDRLHAEAGIFAEVK